MLVSLMSDARAVKTEQWTRVGDDWPERSQIVAGFIAPGSRVLDLGAGAQGLKHRLPPGCDYTPADLHPRTPDTLVFDVAGDDWPDGEWDVACMVGLLEHLLDPFLVVEKAAQRAGRLLVTFWKQATPVWSLDELRRVLGQDVVFDWKDHLYFIVDAAGADDE